MVKTFRLFLISIHFLCFGFSTSAFAQAGFADVTVSSEIDLYQAYENRPLQGTISITHFSTAKIDDSSFNIEGTPIKAEAIKTVRFSPSSNIEMTIYRFTMPGKTQGLYVLPSISVKVDGETYKSIPSSYEVKAGQPSNYAPPPTPSPTYGTQTSSQAIVPSPNTSTTPAILNLKAIVDGLNPMYPGQKAWLTYRFYYNGNIELTKEQLPLLEAAGLEKIGDKRTQEYVENGLSVTEVAQEVQGGKPGTYVFPPSYIEGYAYTENAAGQKTYFEPKLHSETPMITITVQPFPTAGKPVTFKGAVGQFTIQTTLLTPPVATVDEEMKLAIDISGTGELGNIHLPDLSQAGIKQLFRLSDLPPIESITGDTKRFIITLSPLSTSVTNIPSIPFSFFDPLANQYETVNSNPIPITVSQQPSPPPISAPPAAIEPTPVPTPTPQPTPPVTPKPPPQPPPTQPDVYKPKAVEIEGNLHLKRSDLSNLKFGTWSVMWVIPFGIVFILFQIGLKRYLEQMRSQVKPKTSSDIFDEAMSAGTDSPVFYQKLNRAFLKRLAEHGLIANSDIPVENLPADGVVGEVRTFLYSIEEKRFTGDKVATDELLKEAKTLFSKI